MSHYDQNNKEDRFKETLSRVEIARRHFRNQTTQKYIESVAHHLCSKLKMIEIDKYLKELHLRFEHFPTIKQIDYDIEKFLSRMYPPKIESKPVTVTKKHIPKNKVSKIHGMPVLIETVFFMIEEGNTESSSFRIARNSSKALRNLTDQQLWECYEDWCNKKVNKLLKLTKNDIEDVFK